MSSVGAQLHVDPNRAQLLPDQPIAQPHRLRPAPGIVQRRRPFGPVRRAHPLNAPAFLVDGDDRLAPDGLAQISGEPAKLIGMLDIAGKEDEPKGSAERKKSRSALLSSVPAKPENRGSGHYCAVTG